MPILPQIEHIVVVMLENRSLDDMCGWLYQDPASPPVGFLPPGSPARFDGLNGALWNPRNASYFNGAAADEIPVMSSATSFTNPGIDPEETFVHVTYQINGPGPYAEPPKYPMQGFVVDYENATAGNPVEIMEPFSPGQVPILSTLALNYAISDAWFCSVPSQTWPNRSFVHAGTSHGNADNGDPPNPFDWNVSTIFNVLGDMKIAWTVYSDAVVAPSLTRTMFPKLWDPLLDGHFKRFADFEQSCQSGSLAPYSFIEPSFLTDPNDEHPPHDVRAGEQFLLRIWNAVSQSPKWNETLLIVTYDEHGGTYDHVLPPTGATPPDRASQPGQYGFGFDRFGVRVPAILVSPWIEKGTVFRSNTDTHLDHTSILATLRDWKSIPPETMLPSKRVAQAPTLEFVLTRNSPRTDTPTFPSVGTPNATSLNLPPNDLQRSLVTGTAARYGMDPRAVLATVKTRQHAIDFFAARSAALTARPGN
jgi:phospholipase C